MHENAMKPGIVTRFDTEKDKDYSTSNEVKQV